MSRSDEINKLLETANSTPRSIVEGSGIDIPDISESCLDGRLGELCATRMDDFPRAWAWPALLAAASVHVPHSPSIRSNIFTALVGPVGAGKSTVIGVANRLIGVGDSLFDAYVGSAEGLARHLPDDLGTSHRLWFVDELGHLLDKARIEGASFVRVLNTAFNHDRQILVVAKGGKHQFDTKLSIIGGIVDEDFEDAFSAITAHGMYDRFMFGYAPTNFKYNYKPIADYGEPLDNFEHSFKRVDFINPDVWEVRRAWYEENPAANREFEIAIRCALICATYDGREEIDAKSLEPSLVLAGEQVRIRKLLRPNLGRNQGGEISQKITDYIKLHSPEGEWLKLRSVLRGTNAYRYGPNLVNQVLNGLAMCGEIERAQDKESAKKPEIVRMAQ